MKSLLCTVCVDSDPATGFIFDMRVSLRKQLSLLPGQKNISSLPKSSDYGLNELPSSYAIGLARGGCYFLISRVLLSFFQFELRLFSFSQKLSHCAFHVLYK